MSGMSQKAEIRRLAACVMHRAAERDDALRERDAARAERDEAILRRNKAITAEHRLFMLASARDQGLRAAELRRAAAIGERDGAQHLAWETYHMLLRVLSDTGWGMEGLGDLPDRFAVLPHPEGSTICRE